MSCLRDGFVRRSSACSLFQRYCFRIDQSTSFLHAAGMYTTTLYLIRLDERGITIPEQHKGCWRRRKKERNAEKMKEVLVLSQSLCKFPMTKTGFGRKPLPTRALALILLTILHHVATDGLVHPIIVLLHYASRLVSMMSLNPSKIKINFPSASSLQ